MGDLGRLVVVGDSLSAGFQNGSLVALDERFAAGIPRVNLEGVMRDDPLVFPGVGQPAAALDNAGAASVR